MPRFGFASFILSEATPEYPTGYMTFPSVTLGEEGEPWVVGRLEGAVDIDIS